MLGGANKRMKKYPNIISYLEVHYPDVFQIIDDLGMHSILFPHRGRITFIIPDKALVAKLKKLTESDEPEKATDIISYLVLTDLFTSPADFEARKNNIATRLGKRFLVKSISGNKVLLPDGEITPDDGFQPFERSGAAKRENMAVWLLKGTVDPDSAPVIDIKDMKTRKTGGDGDALVASKLRAIRSRVFNAYKSQIAAGDHSHSAYLTAVSRVARIFKAEKQYREEHVKLRSIITKHPVVDFYLLFSCTQLFDPHKVLAAYSAGIDRYADITTINEICEEYPTEYSCALFNRNQLDKLAALRDEVCTQIINRFSGAAAALIETYDILDRDNVLRDLRGRQQIENIYPEPVWQVFRTHKRLHLLIDQFAWDIYRYLGEVEREPDPRRAADLFEDQIKTLVGYYYPLFEDPEKAIIFDKPRLLNLDKKDNPLVNFLRTFALRLPCVHSPDRAKVGSDEAEDPFSQDLIDTDAHIQELMEKLDDDAEITEEDRRRLRILLQAKGKERVLEELS